MRKLIEKLISVGVCFGIIFSSAQAEQLYNFYASQSAVVVQPQGAQSPSNEAQKQQQSPTGPIFNTPYEHPTEMHRKSKNAEYPTRHNVNSKAIINTIPGATKDAVTGPGVQ